MTVAAVILAASPASALADADGTPGVRRLTDVAWAGGATPIVVCSFDPDGAVTAALANAEVTLVDPVDPAGGPVAQIVNGVRAAASLVAETDAALVWPARMTWVDAETVTTLIHAYGEDRSSVARPTSDGEPGWPILLPVRHLDAFAALGADRMPPDLFADLEASGVPFRDIETGDPGVTPRRLDRAGRPAALRRAARARRRPRPRVGLRRGRRAGRRAGHRPRPAHDARRLIRRAPSAPPHGRHHARRPRRGPGRRVRAGTSSRSRCSPRRPPRSHPRPRSRSPTPRRPRMGTRRRDAHHRPHRLSGRQGPARGVRPGGPGDRRRGLPHGDHADAVQPRGVRHRRGRSRPGGAPGDRHLGHRRPLARRLDGGPARRQPAGRLRRARVLGGVRGDRPVGARPRRDVDLRHARRGRGPDVRPEAQAALPPMPCSSPIEGGNHEQMGWYTGQPNDPPATISREDQQAQVVEATVALLDGRRRHAPGRQR